MSQNKDIFLTVNHFILNSVTRWLSKRVVQRGWDPLSPSLPTPQQKKDGLKDRIEQTDWQTSKKGKRMQNLFFSFFSLTERTPIMKFFDTWEGFFSFRFKSFFSKSCLLPSRGFCYAYSKVFVPADSMSISLRVI